MNDFETLKAMLDRAKIRYVISQDKGLNILEVWAGYIGFLTMFEFDEQNNLKAIGAYEE